MRRAVRALSTAQNVGFEGLGLRQTVRAALHEMQLLRPTHIQQLAIPALLRPSSEPRGTVLAAETGAGKTLAYLAPLAELLKRDEEQEMQLCNTGNPGYLKQARPRALVLAPTRELTEQIGAVAKRFAHTAKLRTVHLAGGTQRKGRKIRLQQPLDLVCTMPSRARQLWNDGEVFLGDVRWLVIDEADTMLSATGGFREELARLVMDMKRGGKLSSIVFVGATVVAPPSLKAAFIRKSSYGRDTAAAEARTWMEECMRQLDGPLEVVKSKGLGSISEGLRFAAVPVLESSKHSALQSALDSFALSCKNSVVPGEIRTIIFCNSLSSCRSTAYFLEGEHQEDRYNVKSLHSGMQPARREAEWAAFNAPPPDFVTDVQHKVLICSDIAARGIDFRVDHVVMFDLPSSVSDFMHRVGRTARGIGSDGQVTLLVKNTNRERSMADLLLRSVVPEKRRHIIQDPYAIIASPESRPPSKFAQTKGRKKVRSEQ